MDYSNIFTFMQAEVTLIAVIVLLFLYDLIAGERGRRRFSAVACGLLALQVAVNVVPGTPGEVFGGMFQYVPMHSIVKSVLTVGTLIVFLQADAWLRRGDTAHKQGEFYILTLSTLLGMYFMIGAGNFLLFFIGILCTVGLDVGMNTLTPKLLIERCGLEITDAGLGSSVYFFCRTAGAFIGAFLLARLSDVRYLRVNLIVMLAALGVLYFANSYIEILICVGVFAFALSCVFSIVYSLALRRRPDKANEISGLMITGVCGGAIIPPLMGLLTETVGSQVGSLIILTVCAVYLTFCAYSIKSKANK